jgi:hypothetical protein
MSVYETELMTPEELEDFVEFFDRNIGTDYEINELQPALNRNITEKQKHIVLAEEIGHHFKTTGDITDQSKIENRKQEKLARRWAYEETVGIIKIIEAHNKGIRNKHELAEYLDVTEKRLDDNHIPY